METINRPSALQLFTKRGGKMEHSPCSKKNRATLLKEFRAQRKAFEERNRVPRSASADAQSFKALR
jgi:hypothetical protein